MFKISLRRQTGWVLGIFSATLSRLAKINAKAEEKKGKLLETMIKLEEERNSINEMQMQNTKVIENLKNLLGK